MLPIFQPGLQHSTAPSNNFSLKLEIPEVSIDNLYQPPKDAAISIVHSSWDDLLVYPLSPVVAIEKPLLFEPNLKYVEALVPKIIYIWFTKSKRANLESDSDQDTTSDNIEKSLPEKSAEFREGSWDAAVLTLADMELD